MKTLIAWLRTLEKRGGKGVVNNIDARALGRVASALERTRDVVKVARRAAAMQIVEQWELQEAIAALDALPEGDRK